MIMIICCLSAWNMLMLNKGFIAAGELSKGVCGTIDPLTMAIPPYWCSLSKQQRTVWALAPVPSYFFFFCKIINRNFINNKIESDKAEIAVMGIGNILMQDEGIGVHIIRELEKYDFNPHIALIDGGNMGMDLLPFFDEYNILGHPRFS